MTNVLSRFALPVAEWFRSTLGEPTPVQALGWPRLMHGQSALLLAPTGSGKTLAAFLAALNRLMFARTASESCDHTPASYSRGVTLLYISPLKALAVDVEKNLKRPLAGIRDVAERQGAAFYNPTIALRSGDTAALERARFRRKPTDILITTPESLYLLLTSDAARHLASIETVIVDEIHSVLATKRGAHLALSLERLQALREGRPLQRIGLSATVRPIDEAATLLAGGQRQADGNVERRSVEIIDATRAPNVHISVEVPVRDMDRSGLPGGERSIWSSIHAQLVELVKQHHSTLIFVNNRGLAERLSAAMNDLCGESLVLAHHGAVARERRLEIEEALKSGRLRGLVATSSLELGIDMGAIDLVVQIEAPSSVASGLQRIGRSGHHVGGLSKGIIFPKYRGDLLAAAATAQAMQSGRVEELRYPRCPLDVLAQQVVAIVANGEINKEELYGRVTAAAPYFDLSESTFDSVLELLSGRYPSEAFAELRARITWDRITGKLTPRQGAKRVAIVNGGTIPDRGLYGVFLADSTNKRARRVGELDEEMVFESRLGDVFLLGASSWRIEDITPDRVLVSPAPGQPGRLPFWHGDRVGRSLELGKIVGQLTRSIDAGDDAETQRTLVARGLMPLAAENLITYVRQQREASGTVPSDVNVVIEAFRDELGDFRVCILSPFGSRVHAPWAIAAMQMHRQQVGHESEAVWSDDGIVFRFPEARPPALDLLIPNEVELDDLLQLGLSKSPLFATYFRENAARALLLPRRRPGQRTPLWAQRRRASDLLSAAARFTDFPILLETFRECLRDVFDLPGLSQVLAAMARRELHVSWVNSNVPSPFAASLLFSYAGNFIYNADAPLAERRAQALLVDQAQLRDILGEAELRHLLDETSIAKVEAEVSRRHLKVRHEDDLHDLLLQIGDLTAGEIAERSLVPEQSPKWLEQLERVRRVIRLNINGQERFSAVESVSRLRDTLGLTLPGAVPVEFLGAVKDPLADLVARFARSCGPFVTKDFVHRYPVAESEFLQAARSLEREGRLARGKFLPHGTSDEWCDVEVLRRIKQKSLARLRRAVQPVQPEVFARFLVEWQAAASPRRGQEALLASLYQLQGAPMIASLFESEILPARVLGFHASMLDELTSSGEIVWCGLEPLGSADGRIAVFSASEYAFLAPIREAASGTLVDTVRQALREQGASFFAQLVAATQAFPNDVLQALWALVWSGEVTNDTLAPVRSRLIAHSEHHRPRSPRNPRQVRMPGSEGRWWLLERLRPLTELSDTERLSRITNVFLERYGVLPREALGIDNIAQFSEVYPILKALEEAGRVRRGFFVEGLAPTQFAIPGADDRLRLLREPNLNGSPVTLAATDPANPYGAALPWPESEFRPTRTAGAHVIMMDGALIGYASRRAQSVIIFCDDSPLEHPRRLDALIAALKRMVDGRARQGLLIREINGKPALESHFVTEFLQSGFVTTIDGLFISGAGPLDLSAKLHMTIGKRS